MKTSTHSVSIGNDYFIRCLVIRAAVEFIYTDCFSGLTWRDSNTAIGEKQRAEFFSIGASHNDHNKA